MRVGAGSDIGQVRPVNEDAFCMSGQWFAVADGMGGHQAGEVASNLALEALTQAPPQSEPRAAMRAAFEAANAQIYEASLRSQRFRGMGTTLTAALVTDDRITLGHVGDSRAYLITPSKIVQLTRDHSLVAELVRAGGLSNDEAKHHPQKNVLTRAVGTSAQLDAEIEEHSFSPGEALLLCTDGLTNLVEDGEIHSLSHKTTGPEELVDALIDLANERGGFDNITVVVIQNADEAP